MFDAHDQKWLFIVAIIMGLLIEAAWSIKGGRRARLVEHIYATIGAMTFSIGLLGLVFKILDFSDSVALSGIGISLFAVVDSLSIARSDAEKNNAILEQQFTRLENSIIESKNISYATFVTDAVLRLLKL